MGHCLPPRLGLFPYIIAENAAAGISLPERSYLFDITLLFWIFVEKPRHAIHIYRIFIRNNSRALMPQRQVAAAGCLSVKRKIALRICKLDRPKLCFWSEVQGENSYAENNCLRHRGRFRSRFDSGNRESELREALRGSLRKFQGSEYVPGSMPTGLREKPQ
jgi:hypothetical protein